MDNNIYVMLMKNVLGFRGFLEFFNWNCNDEIFVDDFSFLLILRNIK